MQTTLLPALLACLLLSSHGHEASPEQVHAQLLKPSPGDGAVEVNALVQAVQLDGGLCSTGQGTLSTLAGSAQATQGAWVVTDVLLVFPLELLYSHTTLRQHEYCAPHQGWRRHQYSAKLINLPPHIAPRCINASAVSKSCDQPSTSTAIDVTAAHKLCCLFLKTTSGKH